MFTLSLRSHPVISIQTFLQVRADLKGLPEILVPVRMIVRCNRQHVLRRQMITTAGLQGRKDQPRITQRHVEILIRVLRHPETISLPIAVIISSRVPEEIFRLHPIQDRVLNLADLSPVGQVWMRRGLQTGVVTRHHRVEAEEAVAVLRRPEVLLPEEVLVEVAGPVHPVQEAAHQLEAADNSL
jgi:hypothetical protein